MELPTPNAKAFDLDFASADRTGTKSNHFAYIGGRLTFKDPTNGFDGTKFTSSFDPSTFDDPLWRLPSSHGEFSQFWAPFEAQVPGKVPIDFFEPGLIVDIAWGSGQ